MSKEGKTMFWNKFSGLIIRILLFCIWCGVLAALKDKGTLFFCGLDEKAVCWVLMFIPLAYCIWYIYKCMAPQCGYCGRCGMPDGLIPEEVFADYIEGKVEFVTIASKLYK